MSSWGPQAMVEAPGAPRPVAPRTGGHWIALAVLSSIGAFVACTGAFYAVMLSGSYCGNPSDDMYASEMCRDNRAASAVLWSMVVIVVVAAAVVMLLVGLVEGRRRREFAHGRMGCFVIVALTNQGAVLGYLIGYALGRVLPAAGAARAFKAAVRAELDAATRPQLEPHDHLAAAADPYAAMLAWASQAHGLPGGHLGWTDDGRGYLGTRARGSLLVIGPPGSGKTSAVIIPSVIVAPGACVSSSVKDEVLVATGQLRARRGRVWHFDPGGESTPQVDLVDVLPCRWSPLVGITSWDDARRAASRMAEPMRQADSGGNSGHFLDRARDWLEVLLYAAHVDHRPIGDVADWATCADSDATAQQVLTVLIRAGDAGDPGAPIAARQVEGLLAMPDRERGSVLSTLSRVLRVYGSTAARAVGDRADFDVDAFVRSTDTLYITAAPDRQHEYAPLLAGLLEALRFATYARHRAEATTPAATKLPHVTFVLDEANNTAPVPLPAIVSEAGGQSLHLVVGIQDLSRARARWGKEADGFLTLFTAKLVLTGVVEPYTLDALSAAAGEYDRLTVGYSHSTAYVGQYSVPVPQTNPSYSMQRQRVLHQGDIARLPPGRALLFEGAAWELIRTGMHWQHPVWKYLHMFAALNDREGALLVTRGEYTPAGT